MRELLAAIVVIAGPLAGYLAYILTKVFLVEKFMWEL